MRTTRKEVESVFALLCQATGRRVAKSWNDVGAWSLDYNGAYGGYVVAEHLEHGESRPLGDMRRPAREMADTMRFALRALEQADDGR